MIATLGIDVSQDELVSSLLVNGKISHRTFRNHSDEFAAITKWLQKHRTEAVHVCLEATGSYWEGVAFYLYQAQYKVSVVNPARIHAYGRTLLRRNKTDKEDADLIANFCAAHNPVAWTPPPPTQRELRDLVRLVEDLQSVLSQQIIRLKSGVRNTAVQQVLNEHIAYLKSQIAEVKEKIKQVVASDKKLAHDFKLLISIPGVGEATAALFLAENIGGFRSVRALTAQAGLNPASYSSGTSIHRPPRLSKIGSATLRKALYFPALTAMRFNPCVLALAQRLQQRGKRPMVIVAAAMRKRLTLAFGVLKSGVPFDPDFATKRQLAAI
jgi:transposase